MFNAIKKRFLEMLTEPDGKLSLSRVASGLVVVNTLGWIWYVVVKTSALPDLNGPALFVSGGALHYGIGKWFGKKDGDDSKGQ